MDKREKELIFSAVRLLSVRSELTYWHSLRVGAIVREVSHFFGLDEEEMFFSALAHDIGKIDIDDSVLSAARPLTDLERKAIRRHPIVGFRILERIGVKNELVLKAALEHHERSNGSGYPFQKRDISREIEVIAASDVFDATFIKRPYQKERLNPISVLESQGFDREIIRVFKKLHRKERLEDFLFREAEKIDSEMRGGFPLRREETSSLSKTSTELNRLLGRRRCRPSRRALE